MRKFIRVAFLPVFFLQLKRLGCSFYECINFEYAIDETQNKNSNRAGRRQQRKSFSSQSTQPSPTCQNRSQVTLKSSRNIIELTEEQETYPNPTENPKEEQHQPVPSQSKVAAFKNYFLCISNLWRYLCRSPTRWELDVNDSDFTTAISRLKSKKSYYASVLPAQKQKKKILVLDMDQTLIHTTFTKPPAYDYESEVIFNGRTTKIYTVKRFGLESFLF